MIQTKMIALMEIGGGRKDIENIMVKYNKTINDVTTIIDTATTTALTSPPLI